MTTATVNPADVQEPHGGARTRQLRIAVICDYSEENWPSMDLVGNMLHNELRNRFAATCTPVLVRPTLPFKGSSQPSALARFFGRFVHYPRTLRSLRGSFDLFHIVDHSYAHLLHELPAERTVVTCHDIDTFRCLLPSRPGRSTVFRMMTRRILSGLQKAAHVTCDTEATRNELVQFGLLAREKTTVVHNGVHPALSPTPDYDADAQLTHILGRHALAVPELLHVGSTITRKRIDVLLETFAQIRQQFPYARLLRVGGEFTPQQREHARRLGIAGLIDILPTLDDRLLAAAYRRAAVLLQPSDYEGFGLPVIEAMACGTPVIASDIAPLREVGGKAVVYCPPGNNKQFAEATLRLLGERSTSPNTWDARSNTCLTQSSQFTWSGYAAKMVGVYQRVIQ